MLRAFAVAVARCGLMVALVLCSACATIDVGILDAGFLRGQDIPNLTLLAQCGNPVRSHGTAVAGVIAVAAPNVRMFGCAPDPPVFDETNLTHDEIQLRSTRMLFDDVVAGLEGLLERRPAVINVSVGYNWANRGHSPAASEEVRAIVETHGRAVRKLLRRHPHTLIVSSAGNDCRDRVDCQEPAVWTSPVNWAALGPSSPDDPASPNVVVVEALDEAGNRLVMSNVGGTVRAVGENVVTRIDREPAYFSGTSAAAAQISAKVVRMLAARPDLTVAEIQAMLR